MPTWTDAGNNDEFNDPLNWDPNGVPMAGDTVIVTFGTINLSPDSNLSDNYIEVAGTSGPATLVFTGTDATSLTSPSLGFSTITNTVTDQSGAGQTVIDALGSFVNQGGTIIAAGPAGSTMTVAIGTYVAAATIDPGFFINQGDMEADAGNTLAVTIGADSELFNAGEIIANGGIVTIAADPAAIAGGYAPIVGLLVIAAAGTLEYDVATPGTIGGVRQDVFFSDGAGDLLKIDQVTQFSANILGFEAGDTIDLGAAFNIGSITYNASGILTLFTAAGSILASLDITGNFNTGTFQSGDSFAGSSFDFATGTDSDTLITTVGTNDVWTADSGSNLWTTGSNWQSGMQPGAAGVAVLGNGNTDTYTVVTGAGTVAVGSLYLDDPNATLDVTGTFDVDPSAYESTVQQLAGTIDLTGDGVDMVIDALRQFTPGAELIVSSGASLQVLGRPSVDFTQDGTTAVQDGGDNFGLSLQGSALISGGTVNAGPGQGNGATGGSILIGQDGSGTPATVLADASSGTGASVTATYTTLFSSPTSYGQLTITGANTVWDDAGDPTDTENTSGFMVVGDNGEAGNTPTPPYAGTAQLDVEDGATLDEASYASIASSIDSAGSVLIEGANWNIGNTGTVGTPLGFLQVGRYGAGSMTINDGTVAVGAGGTILHDGTTEDVGFAIDIGHYSGATGTLIATQDGHLLTQGDVIVGDSGTGQLLDDHESFASFGGSLLVGGGKAGADGGTGQVSVTIGSRLGLTADAVLAVWQGSTVYVDGDSALDVGGSGTFIPNELYIENGDDSSGLRGDGTVEADVVNEGSIHATNAGSYVMSTGGLLDITGSLDGSGTATMAPGATLEVDGAVAYNALPSASQAFHFDTQNGLPETLILGTPGAGFANAVTNMQNLDRIELGGIAITGATFSAGTVTVTTSGATYLLTDVSLNPDASTAFTHGHDSVSGDDYIQVTCFAAGTRIATQDGEVAVERLAVGQRVLTVLDGGAKPIVWIGRRRIDCRRHPRPDRVWPVRIAAGAFGPHLPARALFLSPDHAVYVGGVLIPVKYLVNGDSVAQVPVDSVTYHHIELAAHDVVVAEGLPAESYLDIDDHATFGKSGGKLRLHPDLSPLIWEAKGCAPLVVTGPALDTACAQLAALAYLGAAPGAHWHTLAA